VACFYNEDRVVIHDLETGEQKEIEIKEPWKSSSSAHFIAVTTVEDGLHLFSTKGELVHIIPESMDASCAAFHPHNINILCLGYKDGTVRIWNVSIHAYVSDFKEHTHLITNIRFAPDCRLFLSSWDDTASIVTLDGQFRIVSSVKLEGHTAWVNDIIWLPSSNQVVTCSVDETIKLWDCKTGECLQTLTDHTDEVKSLTFHPNGHYFASGSFDETVIIWSCKTFEVFRCITFPNTVYPIMFVESDTLYIGVYEYGVMSCSALTGEAGPVIIPGTGCIRDISLSKLPLFTRQCTTHSHSSLHSTCIQTLDFTHACTVALACTTHCAHGCGGAVEGLQAVSSNVSAIRACGDHIAPCAVAQLPFHFFCMTFVASHVSHNEHRPR
jgi:WD40 repeat protein